MIRLLAFLGLMTAVVVSGAAFAAEPVVIKVSDGMFFWNEDAGSPGGPAVSAFVDDFMQRHPDIKIERVSNPRHLGVGYDDVMAWHASRAASGTMPDIFWVHNWNSGELIDNGLALDLTPYIERDASYDISDFPPPIWGAWSRGERTYGIPTSYSAYLPMVNLNLTRAAGLADPGDDPWTMDDLKLYMRSVAKDVNGDGQNEIWGGESRMVGFYSAALRPFGADFLNADESEVTVDRPEAIRAFEFWKEMRVDEGLISRNSNLFYQGKAGFVVHEPPSLSTELGQAGLVEAQGYLVPDIAPPIANEGGSAYGQTIGSAWVVAAGTQHPQEAWTFLRELTSAQTMTMLAEKGVPGMDARISAARVSMDAWKRDWPSLNIDRYIRALSSLYYERPISKYAWTLKRVMGKYWNQMFDPTNGISPAAAAEKMATEMRGIINGD